MLNFSLVSVFLISLGLLLVMIFNTNPINSSNFVIISFFSILLVFLFTLFSTLARSIGRFMKRSLAPRLVLRRSLLLSILVVGITVFMSLKVLNVLSALTFTIALVLVEFFFSSRKIEKEYK